MNILLIWPEYPDTFWSWKKTLDFIKVGALNPPLSLLTIAPLLPADWDKKIIDCNIENLTDENIDWADLILISGMIIQKDNAKKIISHCKQKNKIVIAGGPLFTTDYESFDDVDHFILDEGEITIPIFLEDFKKGAAKHIYTSTERPDLTKSPMPDWSLINIKNYYCMPIQFSRGCPFNCEFCDVIIMNGRTPRHKKVNQMISEFEMLYKTGWNGWVFIVDDNFIGNKTKAKELLQEIIEWQEKRKFPFTFLTQASINLAEDKELLKLMRKANFAIAFIGIETPNIESLKEAGKYQNLNMNLVESIKTIQKNGISVMGGFIVGFDNDKEDIFNKLSDFILETGICINMMGILMPLPKTRLWHRLEKENRLLVNVTGDNMDGDINFIPKMGMEELLNGYKKILSTVYSRDFYYKTLDNFLKNYSPTFKQKFKFVDIIRLFKLLFYFGIYKSERLTFWKIFFKTIKSPRIARVALDQIGCLIHFEYIAKKVEKI